MAWPRPHAFVFLVPILAASGAVAVQPSSDTHWYSIVAANGARVGHASQEVRNRDTNRETVESYEIRVIEPNNGERRITERTSTIEDAQGRVLSISQVTRIGRQSSRIDARIANDNAEIVRETTSERRTVNLALPRGVRFDNGEGLLRRWNPRTTPRLEFDNFSIGAMAIEHVVIEPVAGAIADSDGRLLVWRRRYDRGALRTVARLLLEPDGRIASISQPMFGTTLTVRATTREDALRSHPPFSVLRSAMVRSPFRIMPGAATGHIRYRFSFREGLSFPLPETREQRVTPSPDGVTVDICRDCGPDRAEATADLAAALRPTAWLQSDHPRIRAIAAPVARLRVSDSRRMELLAQRVRERMPIIDFTGHFSALETLSRGAGDCTEAAVLLAALGRAAGIPTRVASGLVYSRERYHGVSNVFMPHSWVLAWADGEWRSFDAALFDFDSTHIALTIGDGDERSIGAASQLAGLLQWESMTEVRRRTAG